MLTRQQWDGFTQEDCRRVVGEDPEFGSYMLFFEKYFGKDRFMKHTNSYDMYVIWYREEMSPLGQALK